jgi:hypothetical protein
MLAIRIGGVNAARGERTELALLPMRFGEFLQVVLSGHFDIDF